MHLTYRKANNVIGFIIFLIAATVYCLTIEPTASFWDCGEFILSAYKLEVGHPPGAPFFMLTANFFTQFTQDTALVARMVNYMSALMSAATILLLYFTITHLVGKLVTNTLLILSCGAVGALAYTFSDTFWFSAVEGEVYAFSSLFTALVFWLILKWEDQANEPHSDRWLILIAYLMGLSIGVHLLNLLCIPAIVLVYYYRKRPDSPLANSIPALIASGILIVIILYGIVPGITKVGGWFELFAVNTLKLPFNSGIILYCILLTAVYCRGIYESHKRKSPGRTKLSLIVIIALLGIPFYGYGTSSYILAAILMAAMAFYLYSPRIPSRYRTGDKAINTIILSLMMFVIGYSCYGIILIRSSANPPMDQNSPEDIFSLSGYLGRESYEQPPLIYGHAFSSERKLRTENNYCVYDYREGKPVYTRKTKETKDEKDTYLMTGHRLEPVYAQNMLFPRMYSDRHASYGTSQTNLYKRWVNIKGHTVPYDRCGEMVYVNMPTQWENIRFFFNYQINFMYWRYFFWNFVGRQNDIQGNGELEHGNWITGISFVDQFLVGNQEFIPTDLKNNKGRNVYYGLPLLLGILGLMWQLKQHKKGKQSFILVFMLFFMTGIAIILYLNQTPMQIRERDYAYAGSFYAFSIWIGMGVAALAQLFRKKLKKTSAVCAASAVSIFIPLQMASQTWDDHDRSNRSPARDFGRNYLVSAQEGNHPILFNMGDNDTFPLWYSQEVEGYRTDVRPCNLSYLQTDWYIDQMKRDAYDSPALPISWKKEEYASGTSEAVAIRPDMKEHIDNYYRQSPEKARQEYGENPYELQSILKYWVRHPNEQFKIIPTDSLVMKLDKKAIKRSGMMIPVDPEDIPEYMPISLKGRRYLTKNDLMMLEILANCNWERPVYVATSVGPDGYLCFEKNLCQEGLLYRFTPFDTARLNARMDTEKTYDLLMNKYTWGGIENPNIYLDENTLRMYASTRRIFGLLAKQLLEKGEKDKAKHTLEHCAQVIPIHHLPYDYQNGAFDLANSYYQLNEKKKGDEIMKALVEKSMEYINWYTHMPNSLRGAVNENCLYHFYLLNEETKIMEEHNSEQAEYYSQQFNKLYEKFKNKAG